MGGRRSFALNGELVRDYLASGLGQSPMAFALEWFRHYPAVTISLYPPIFPLAEAAVFALFGFSHAAALATVTLFVALAAVRHVSHDAYRGGWTGGDRRRSHAARHAGGVALVA